MKFFKNIFTKQSEVETKEEKVYNKEVKTKSKKKNIQSSNQQIKYKKKKDVPLRKNKVEDFENKTVDHNIKTEVVANEVDVQWKKTKVKKSYQPKKKEENIEQLFGMEIKEVSIGDITNAEVLACSKDGYIVSINDSFVEATMPLQEYDGTLEVGETVNVVIYRLYDGIYYASNRRVATVEMIEEISKLYENGETVKASIIDFKHNFFGAKINDKIDAQIYAANIDTIFVNEENANDYIGKTYEFLITKKLNSKKYKFELSRKKLLQDIQKEIIGNLEVGEEISASNFKLNKGGVEFDYNGIRGFVPIAEISNLYINGVDDIPNHLDLNAETQMQIIEIKKRKNNVQIIASIKSLKPSPWNNFIEKYGSESMLEAKITDIRPYGFMVALDCDITTLLHKNNMSQEMLDNYSSFKINDTFEIKIDDIDFDKKRVNITTKF